MKEIFLLENETFFDRLFCDVNTGSGFSIYYNSYFSDDPIFNHAFLSQSILNSEKYDTSVLVNSLEKIASKTSSLQIPATLYLERIWRNVSSIEKDAIDFGFVITEQIHILTKKISSPQSAENPKISVSLTRDVDLWNNAFVKSFSIPESWISELTSRLGLLLGNANAYLIVAKEEGFREASGCLLAVVNPPDIMGVYCVGTVPERRSRGVARAMMNRSEVLGLERNCKTMVLQTLASDGVTPMYLKMGFETAMERDVLQLR
jgi:GNAT superfamily N-acetyltransferase